LIKDWSFIKERRVQLAEGENLEFIAEITRRNWRQLVEPMPKYDPEVVLEFYANAWPTEEEAPKCGANGFLMILMLSTNF